jgi:hypothetical protein
MSFEKQHYDLPSDAQEPSAEDFQARIDRLLEIICALLMKNQVMRMAMLAENREDDASRSR